MSKKVQVFGIDIDNYTVRETMLLLEEYISTDGLNIVELISPELLLAASEQEELRKMVDNADLQIIGDVAIFEVLPEVYEQNVNEIQKRELEEQFLRSLIRKKKTVYWIVNSEEYLQTCREYIEENYKDLHIAGFYAGAIDEENTDYIINEINSAAPDVIFTHLPFPLQESFIYQNRNRLNARLCMCLGMYVKSKYPLRRKISKIKALIDLTLFKRKAIKYAVEHEKNEVKEDKE